MAFTYFFRDLQTIDILTDKLLTRISGRRQIKIWDAGCASGEEPYTLAITLAEKMNKYAFNNLRIHATDIDISNQFGKIIKNGVYPYHKLKRIPKHIFRKYFAKYDSENNYQLISSIRNKVVFKREDLLSLNPTDFEFSAILCKNVLLHQKNNERINIIKMFHKSLTDSGVIAMEHTQKLPKENYAIFEKIVSNAQIFEKK